MTEHQHRRRRLRAARSSRDLYPRSVAALPVGAQPSLRYPMGTLHRPSRSPAPSLAGRLDPPSSSWDADDGEICIAERLRRARRCGLVQLAVSRTDAIVWSRAASALLLVVRETLRVRQTR
jgi:hypothetical protein